MIPSIKRSNNGKSVKINRDRPTILIGERINPTGDQGAFVP
jgi:cobalamin-dependent methionine synthase I